MDGMEGMDEILAEFIADSGEMLEQVDLRLVELEEEEEGNQLATVNELFRLMHTVKGTCGFLQLNRMMHVAHAAETLMDKLRSGTAVTRPAIDAVLAAADRLKLILGHLETVGVPEPEGDDSEVIAALEAAMEAGAEGEAPSADSGEPAAEESAEAEHAEASAPEPAAASEPDAPPPPPTPAPAPAAKAAAKPAGKDAKGDAKPDAPPVAEAGERSIRVAVETLEYLMTVVSELVLTRNELTEIMRNHEGANHKLALQRLSNVTGELQQAVMSTRMQPIGNAWRKLPRVVRDVSAALGKQIELVMSGEGTELDRQVLELIRDPLMHMVRNSCDHGLETTQDRLAAGKSEKGRVTLNAYHEGGQILVEIADDGRGLNRERIQAKAVENGLLTAEDAERLADEQIYPFIFEPGFSTAEKVTNVSGRGVGMDVVRSNVDRIGGQIDVRSTPGLGSVFTLKIPLTLAILQALIVGVEDEELAVPQSSVDELLRVEPGGAHSIQLIKDAPVVRSRDRLLPVVDLRDVLKIGEPGPTGTRADENTQGFVMVMRARGMRFGMLVDGVLRTEEIVVKPMPSTLRGLEIFSGATILGDGRVIMIVDPNGVRAAANSVAENSMNSAADEEEASEVSEDRQPLLVFQAGSPNRKIVPISLITRLEELSLKDAQYTEGQWHMRYHDELIPLVWFGATPDPESEARVPLLVMSDAGRSMGLIVDRILDIVEDSVYVQLPSDKPGILGSAIIGEEGAEVIDVSYFLGLASRHWFDPGLRKVTKGSILLVDDSAFFRNLVAPVVRSAGFRPVVCESGKQALDKLAAGLRPTVIVSDVDMPEMDGFEFAERVRSDTTFDETPILALTGIVTPEAISQAREAGFSDYISKLDRNGLIQSLREFTASANEEQAA